MQPLSAPATQHTIAYLGLDNEELGANHPGYCRFSMGKLLFYVVKGV